MFSSKSARLSPCPQPTWAGPCCDDNCGCDRNYGTWTPIIGTGLVLLAAGLLLAALYLAIAGAQP